MNSGWAIGVAAGAIGLSVLSACGSTSRATAGHHPLTTTASSEPPSVALGSSAASASGEHFSASPFASPVTGTVVVDAAGSGARSLAPLPRTGSLEVVYSCSTGSMSVTRKPDIKATFSCVDGPSLITFAATKVVNANPVRVTMTDPEAKWTIQLILS